MEQEEMEDKCWSLLDRQWFILLKNTTILKDSYNDSLTFNSSAVLKGTVVLKICQRCFKSECMWHRISWHRFWIVWCELFFDHIFFLENVLSSLSTYQCGSNGTHMHCAWQTKNFWIAGPFGNVCVIPDFFPSVWGYKENRIHVSSPSVLRRSLMTAQPILWSWYFFKKGCICLWGLSNRICCLAPMAASKPNSKCLGFTYRHGLSYLKKARSHRNVQQVHLLSENTKMWLYLA